MMNYQEIRPLINSGDILLCSGSSLFSRMIQKFTKSKWSHVAFIIRLDIIDRIMVLESVESIGVRCVPLSAYFNNYNGSRMPYSGELMIARHKDMCESHIEKLSQHAVDLLGHQYDSAEIARIASRIATSFVSKGQCELPTQDDVYICSEYVYECFKSIGIMIHHSCGFVAPKDFADDHNIHRILNF
jgi:hypothetical protein